MKWTPEQIVYLREHYANRKNSELAQDLGCSTHAVANKGFSLKLKKSREFINRPHNTLPVGSERVDRDGYLWVKIGSGRRDWRLKHHMGLDVPKGYKVIFIDGNKRNFDKANLMLVSNAELMNRNTMLRFPIELQNTLRAIKKLQRTIENA